MIVGFVGFINSGKNSAAQYLTQKYSFKEESYANSLKNALVSIFGWDRELIEGKTEESRIWRETVDPWWSKRLNIPHLTPRWVMQNFATEVCRGTFHNDIWVASLEKKLQNTDYNYVISDVRFKNEYKSLKSIGATIIRIKRGDDPVWFEDAVLANAGDHVVGSAIAKAKMRTYKIHLSEWEWTAFTPDHIIENNGTLSDLYKKIDQVLKI
jgi:hypothetical protein